MRAILGYRNKKKTNWKLGETNGTYINKRNKIAFHWDILKKFHTFFLSKIEMKWLTAKIKLAYETDSLMKKRNRILTFDIGRVDAFVFQAIQALFSFVFISVVNAPSFSFECIDGAHVLVLKDASDDTFHQIEKFVWSEPSNNPTKDHPFSYIIEKLTATTKIRPFCKHVKNEILT